jgi:hypothetical protein
VADLVTNATVGIAPAAHAADVPTVDRFTFAEALYMLSPMIIERALITKQTRLVWH